MTNDDTAALVARLRQGKGADPDTYELHEEAADAIERAVKERDGAIEQLAKEARARGEAEGRLRASQWPGVVEGWQKRAEGAERQLAEARGAADSVLFHWFECEGECNQLQESMEGLRDSPAGQPFRDYLARIDGAATNTPTPAPHRARWAVVAASGCRVDGGFSVIYNVLRDGEWMNKEPFLSEIEATSWMREQVNKAREDN